MNRRAIALLFAAALAACVPPRGGEEPAPAGQREAIVRVLEESTEEWNRGNLEGFLVPYDASTTFVGSRGLIRGRDAVRDQYRNSYFRSGVPEGRLSFRDIEVRDLGGGHALAVGRYVVVERASGRETATGLFSLVLRRTPEGWRIIHDHSS